LYDVLAHHRIAELEEAVARLRQLLNIECVLPLQRNEVAGVGLVLSILEDDPSAAADALANAVADVPRVRLGLTTSIITGRSVSVTTIATLAGGIDDGTAYGPGAVIPLSSVAALTEGIEYTLQIENEQITGVVTGGSFVIACRGAYGTVAVAHVTGVTVKRSEVVLGSGTVTILKFALRPNGSRVLHNTCESLTVYNDCPAIPDDTIVDLFYEANSGDWRVREACSLAMPDGSGTAPTEGEWWCVEYDDTETCGAADIPSFACDDGLTALTPGVVYGPFTLSFPSLHYFAFDVTDTVDYHAILTWVSGGDMSGTISKGPCASLSEEAGFDQVNSGNPSSCAVKASPVGTAKRVILVSSATTGTYTIQVNTGLCP